MIDTDFSKFTIHSIILANFFSI